MIPRIINLIPANYLGDPRKALGYAWQDYGNRIPGEDIVGVRLDAAIEDLQKQHGKIAVRNDSTYGWLKTTADTPAGETFQVSPDNLVARINCMWCGGGDYSVFTVAPDDVSVDVAAECGSIKDEPSPLEARLSGMTREQIKQAEREYDDLYNEGAEGYNPFRSEC